MPPHDDSTSQDAQEPFPLANLATLLKQAASRGPHDPVRIRVIDLLGYWNASRRTPETIATVRAELDKYSLVTAPALTDVWIHSEIELRKERRREQKNNAPGTSQDKSTPQNHTDDAWNVGALRAANQEVVAVAPNDSIVTALTRMTHHNYSQLAVVENRTLKAVISNRSIAQATPNAIRVHEATERAEPREAHTPVKDIIDVVNSHGYVVIVHNSSPKGIVTTADLSEEFYLRDRPVAIIGRIETRVRNRVLQKLDHADYERFIPRWNKDSENAAPSMGAYVKLFEDNSDVWKKMEWNIDISYFIEKLKKAVDVRNEIMHFAPDPPEAEKMTDIERFAETLFKLTQN